MMLGNFSILALKKINKLNLNVNLKPHTTIDSKWIIDINAGAKNIKLLGKKIGENLHDLVLGKEFLGIAPISYDPWKGKWKKQTSLKIKTFTLQKTPLRKWKHKPQTGRTISNSIYDKGHIKNI